MKAKKIYIKEADDLDYKVIAKLASETDAIVTHDPHFYKIIIDYFGDTALVAKDDKEIVGWTFGIPSQIEKGLFFLWQIVVSDKLKRCGIGYKLLNGLMDAARKKGMERIRSTILPSNFASISLFRKAGFQNVSIKLGGESDGEMEYVENYYGEGEDMAILERSL